MIQRATAKFAGKLFQDREGRQVASVALMPKTPCSLSLPEKVVTITVYQSKQ